MPNVRPRYETQETARLEIPNWIAFDAATKRYARQEAARGRFLDVVAVISLLALLAAWVMS